MTKIEWTHRPGTTGVTWNPVTGCTKTSAGCVNCYASRMSKRLAGRCGYPEAPHQFDVTLHPDKLDQPSRWKKPRTIFVVSMGDLFHEDVPSSFICEMWQVMRECRRHTFMILTKRAARMRDVVKKYIADPEWGLTPLPNVWLGVTAENQEMADKRIPMLLQIPAAVRFASVEPMLGPVDLERYIVSCNDCGNQGSTGYITRYDDQLCRACSKGEEGPALDWVICGGESGPGARPMHPDWVRGLRDQCEESEIPFFFKQWGAWFPRSQWEHNPELVLPDDDECEEGGVNLYLADDISHRVGKHAAGRLLDGREWNEWPEVAR